MSPDVDTAPSRPALTDDGDWARRKQQLTVAAAIIAVLAFVAAAVFWYAGSGGGAGGTKPLPPLQVHAGDHALLLGPAAAPHTVVVHEDFGDTASREWDQATRDFLKADATAGLVRVEYLPFTTASSGYGTDAAIAFGTVLTADRTHGAEHALALHALLFDHQVDPTAPSATQLARWSATAGARAAIVMQALDGHDLTWVRAADAAAKQAGVRAAPTVLLDGRPVPGATLAARADALERALAGS